jgi:hypothetical protein
MDWADLAQDTDPWEVGRGGCSKHGNEPSDSMNLDILERRHNWRDSGEERRSVGETTVRGNRINVETVARNSADVKCNGDKPLPTRMINIRKKFRVNCLSTDCARRKATCGWISSSMKFQHWPLDVSAGWRIVSSTRP